MRTRLSMFDEVVTGNRLEVGVVVESDGTEVVGRSEGPLEDRLAVVARAALAAARNASTVKPDSDFVGVVLGEMNGSGYVLAMVHDVANGEPLFGAAYLRQHEDQGKATIRAVFAALNRRFEL
jgi:hypothetical protein